MGIPVIDLGGLVRTAQLAIQKFCGRNQTNLEGKNNPIF